MIVLQLEILRVSAYHYANIFKDKLDNAPIPVTAHAYIKLCLKTATQDTYCNLLQNILNPVYKIKKIELSRKV